MNDHMENVMVKKASIAGSIEAWESRALGASEAHAKPADQTLEDAIDAALGLRAISIRLPKATIDVYKALAKIHGVGYQPLMRDAICRWAEAELKQMVIAAAEQADKSPAHDPDHPAPMKKAA